jgi:uncharacterized spore protein YtfJ
MEDVEKLLKGTVEELDQLLNAKYVLGDPIERDGATVIPIVSYGFGQAERSIKNREIQRKLVPVAGSNLWARSFLTRKAHVSSPSKAR